jgi:2-methylcitrate dehydratase PrpD
MMDADTFLDSLAAWASQVRITDIPMPVRDAARRCIADTMAVGFAGSKLAVSKRAHAWACEHYRDGAAGLLNRHESLVAPAAALVNAVACHAMDFDDTCYEGVVHASAVVFPAALAACQSANADGAALLLAYCVGCQVEVELGRRFTGDLYDRGWFNTSMLGTFGAAAAASKAFNLPATQYREALALAAVEAAGIRAVLGSQAKPWLAGRAAEAGVRCAQLARDGLTATASVLEGPNGFIRTHLGKQLLQDEFTPARRWALVDPGFALKLYPVCSAAQAAVEELGIMRAELGLSADDVHTLTVAGTHLVVRSLRYRRPESVEEAQFSMQFALACMLQFGDLGPAQLTQQVVRDPQLQSVMERISLIEDSALENCQEQGRECPEPARLRVELHSGQVIERTRLAASGMPQRCFTSAQSVAKFERCGSAAGWQPPAIRSLYAVVAHIDELQSLRALAGTVEH